MSDYAEGAYLEFKADGTTHRFTLATVCQIGRSANSHLVLGGEMVSRQHAMLQRSDGGQFYITDLGSSNGTLVNGVRISVPTILSPGDQVTVGIHKLVLCQTTAAPAPEIKKCDMTMTSMSVEQKFVTVLVVDIRGFTGLAQRIDPNILAQATGTWFRDSGRLLQERGAWAQKYIGDAIMAVWQHRGLAPAKEEFYPILDGLCRLSEVASRLQSQFQLQEPILIGAGINSGFASVGNVGSAATADYTALGDVVNKAFRLEAATRTERCDLLIGKDTQVWLASGSSALTRFEQCPVILKGYTELETAYRCQMDAVEEFLQGRSLVTR